MWICPRCGEPHQDQFKECWKCAGPAEADTHVIAEAPRPALPAPDVKLRSMGSIMLRAGVGCLIGLLLSFSSFNFIRPESFLPIPDQGTSPAGRTILALIIGAIFGLLVGLFFWVMFPYESTGQRGEVAEPESAPDDPLT